MAKRCPKCATELPDEANVCSSCGASLNANPTPINNVGGGAGLIQKREIALAIILSIVTCGIYGLYWFVCMTNDANKVSGEDSPSGGVALLLSIVTCGLYSIYWCYKMGKKLATAQEKHGRTVEDNSVLYLILTIVGLSIVSWGLIQNELNKFAE